MSSALALGLEGQEVEFSLFNPTITKAQALSSKLSKAAIWNGEKFDAIVLGFKPQKLSEAVVALKPLLKPDTLIISLLAGVKIQKLQSLLGTMVLRLMPNLAIAEGKGVCLWSSSLSANENVLWQKNFNALGFAPLISEIELDLYTLHAGCSPAYMYFLIQEMKDFAAQSGGDSKLAAKILIRSLQGALNQLSGEEDFNSLITQVASKGGVTEATLKSWKESGAIDSGLKAGLDRIQQLS